MTDLDELDMGMVFDMITEKGNDEIEWPYEATQEDMDKF